MKTPANVDLAELGSTVASFYECAWNLRNETGYSPAPASEGEAECSTLDGTRHLPNIAYSSAKLLLQSAEDFMMCLARVIIKPVPQFGHLTLARCVMEQSARAWWLLEPGVGMEERGRRGAAEFMYNCSEALMTDRAAGESAEVAQWIAEVTAMLSREGFQIERRKDGRLRLLGAERPGATSLMKDFLGELGEISFRYYSAVTHGVAYGLMESFAAGPSDIEDSTHLAPSVTFEDVAGTCYRACLAHALAFDRQVEVFGWPRDEWLTCRAHGLEKIGTLAGFGA